MKIKDVSQSTNFYEIVEAIQHLNPNAEIRIGSVDYDSQALLRFYSSVPMEQLVLPEGFYCNQKNEVTNKHNTQSGAYCALKVEDLSLADERKLMPKKPQVKDVSQSTNFYEIVEAIQQLNPNAEIRIGSVDYDSQALLRFYSSVPMEQLVLPEGFYCNQKNGVTNKHNTQSGAYCALKVEDLSLADERKLMPKVVNIVKVEKANTSEMLQRVKGVIVETMGKLKEKVMNKGVDQNDKHR